MYYIFLNVFFALLLSAVLCFSCNDTETFCEVCKSFETIDGIKTYFDSELCSIYVGISDENVTTDQIPINCELLFSSSYPSSCQLAVISDVDLLGAYIEHGIRSENHRMLLALYRDDCSETWRWHSRLDNQTSIAGFSNSTEACDISQAAFSGLDLVRINPLDFNTTGVLCQCSVDFPSTVLPTTTKLTTTTEIPTTTGASPSTIVFQYPILLIFTYFLHC